MKKRIHVFYGGRVQGVGFRMTADETAHRMDVVGWVKNLRDGRVEIVAEAEEHALQKFLKAIAGGAMRNFITDTEVSWSEATGTFDEFSIRYF